MDRIKKAYEFMVAAHMGQERKFTGEAYTMHLEETSQLLWEATAGATETDMYVAALLHDVVEDTDVTIEEVGREFGGCVMSLVNELTINEEDKAAEGKKICLARKINEMSEPAFLIKLCDRLSNVTGLIDHRVTDKFVIWYIKETQYLLEHIDRKLTDTQAKLIDKIEKTIVYLRLNRNF